MLPIPLASSHPVPQRTATLPPLHHPRRHPACLQAGVPPELPVWNSLLGAYGRAGSVDAAYAAWLKVVESGTVMVR